MSTLPSPSERPALPAPPARPVQHVPARPARPPNGRARVAVGSIWFAVIGAALLAGIGIATPRLALRAAIVVAIGAAAIVLASVVTDLLRRVPPATTSAFEPIHAPLPPAVLPRHVAAIRPEAVDPNAPLSSGARQAIVSVATERLWARHDLNLYDRAHHEAIQRIVSPLLWAALQPRRYGADRRHQEPHREVHQRELSELIDELERL